MTVTDSALEADIGLGYDFDYNYSDELARGTPTVIGQGDSRGATRFESDRLLGVRVATGTLLIEPTGIDTTDDGLSISGQLPASFAESDAVEPLRTGGDVNRVDTAFGAFRRLAGDGRDQERLVPPTSLSPPFVERDGFVLDASFDPISPTRYAVELSVGLAEPRAREPIGTSSAETIALDTQSVSVDGGATSSITLSGEAPSDVGDYIATVSSPSDSDDALTTVSADDETTLLWPAASLSIPERRLGRIRRAPDQGIETIEIPLRLTAEEAAKLFAVGSRVGGATTRAAEGATDRAVDTLPNEELTASVDAPSDVPLDGELILRDWDCTVESVGKYRYDVTIGLIDA